MIDRAIDKAIDKAINKVIDKAIDNASGNPTTDYLSCTNATNQHHVAQYKSHRRGRQ